MLNLVSLSTQSLASCVNYFVWNCLTCFSNTKIGSVTSFSILFNFQGPVRLSLSGWQLDYFTTEVIFCQVLFSEAFRSFRTCGSFFNVSILVLFALLLPLSEVILSGGPWRSSIIPHPQPSVNTFLHLFWVFSIFLEFVSFPRPGVSFLSHKQHKAPRANAGLWNTNDHSSPRPDSARYRVVSSVYSRLAPTGRP